MDKVKEFIRIHKKMVITSCVIFCVMFVLMNIEDKPVNYSKTTSTTTTETKEDKESISYRVKVFKFIEERYEYYDKLDKKYTGDKYSEKIWQETESKFNITKEFIDTKVWGDIEVIEAAGKSY